MSDPRPAIIAADGTFTYEQLDDASRRVASALLAGREDLDQDRVAFLVIEAEDARDMMGHYPPNCYPAN